MGNVGLDLLGNKILHLEILVMSKKRLFWIAVFAFDCVFIVWINLFGNYE